MEAEPVLIIASPPATAIDCQEPSVVGSHASLSDYWEPTKPEVNFLIDVATLTGFYLGSPGPLDYFALRRLVHSLPGTQLARLLLCVATLMGLQSISMQGQSHVAEPAVNLGDSSFLDGIGGPGFLLEQMNDFQHDSRITNSSGQTEPGSGSVNSASGLSHVAWLAHQRILGGWYGLEVVGVEAYVDAGSEGHRGGFGDLTVSPLILQWPEKRVFGIRIDQRFDVDFGVPVGWYSRTSNVNLSSNAFNVQPYYTITAYPKKRIETSWRFHHLWNATNDAPPVSTGAQSTQAGQAIHFNATAAYNVYKGLWIGANGYYLKQITDGRINGVPLPDSPEQVGAIGPGMVWNAGHWYYYANFYQELGAENRPTGPKLVLRIEKVF